MIARALWLALVSLALALFTAGLPLLYDEFRTLSISNAVDRDEVRANLANLGVSLDFYAGYYVAVAVALSVGCFGLAALIYWRRSDEPIALFVAVALVLLGATFSGANEALGALHPVLRWLGNFLDILSGVSLFLFFYVFPDGRFVPWWTRWPVVFSLSAVGLLSLFPDSRFNLDNWPESLYAPVLFGWLFMGLLAQIYRYRRMSNPSERQQAKWVVFGFATALAGFLGLVSIDLLLPGLQPGTLADFAITAAIHCFMLVIPLSLAIAILRYRLWDIDVIVNRTLVYGTLTAASVGIYALVVVGLGALLHAPGNLLVSLLAAGLVAVLFAPLRERLQRAANRLMYGERDDPYAVLSRLGRRLETTMAPEAALGMVAEAVSQALKLPYTAIELEQDGAFRMVSEYGEPKGAVVMLPLVHQQMVVGRMFASSRGPGEGFSRADDRLLEDLARQASAAAHAAHLTADLRRSRERLVNTREEERRRLRRDLHDGLGPALSGLTLGIDAVRGLFARDPKGADALLAELGAQTQDAVSDIRRLVYGLRPPALDDVGLLAAIRQQAAKHGTLAEELTSGTHLGRELIITVEAPAELPTLTAAVEVAIYRIAQEAITNVSRHAEAHACRVRLSVDGRSEGLWLEILDDGLGIAVGRSAGVGLTSMRERAEELGGILTIEPILGGGTRVLARLPLPAKEE